MYELRSHLSGNVCHIAGHQGTCWVRSMSLCFAGNDILASLMPFPWFYQVMCLASKSSNCGQQFLEQAILIRVPDPCLPSLLYKGFTSVVGGSLEQRVASQVLPQ